MSGGPQILGYKFLALSHRINAALQRTCCLLQQPALALSADQTSLTGAEIILSEHDQASDQFLETVTATCRYPQLALPLDSFLAWVGHWPSRVEVDLVAHQPDRCWAFVRDPLIRCVGQPQHQVRLFRPRTGA